MGVIPSPSRGDDTPRKTAYNLSTLKSLKAKNMLEQALNLIIPNAYAQTAGQPQQGGGISMIVMLVVFVVFMYFTIWRPQSKRAKEQQDLINSLAKGDEVMIAGGLLGRIAKLSDQYMSLTVANEVNIVVQKSSVVSVLPKGTLKSIE